MGLKRFLPLFFSIFILMLCVHYYTGMAQKDYFVIYLGVIDSVFAKQYRMAKTSKDKERLSNSFAKVITTLIWEIENRPGTWKKMHVVYHTIARASLALGRIGDAGRFLKRALHYHPYYANAYEMLGNVWKLQGRQRREKACKAVATAILNGNPTKQHDIKVCNS